MKTYIIKNTVSGLFKIGKSKHPLKRVSQVEPQKGSCKLLITINRDCESMLHNAFATQHVNKEWFLLSNYDLKAIYDYSIGINTLTHEVSILGHNIEILKKNNFISLKHISQISIKNDFGGAINAAEFLHKDGIKYFMDDLKIKFGLIMTSNGSGAIWCHILLFLEIARSLHPKFKIEVYETLLGNTNFGLYEIVKSAIKNKIVL